MAELPIADCQLPIWNAGSPNRGLSRLLIGNWQSAIGNLRSLTLL
jgi:hypothetical protein